MFGPALQLPYVTPMDTEPEIIRVYKDADEKGGVFGGDWHSDFSFLEVPPSGSVLNAHTLPPFGGDTLWASQAAAWDALPGALQELLLDQIQRHVTRPEFCIRYSWTPGTIAVWDNLATQHYAVNDYQGHERLMYRTTFSGLTPRDMAAVPEKTTQAAASAFST